MAPCRDQGLRAAPIEPMHEEMMVAAVAGWFIAVHPACKGRWSCAACSAISATLPLFPTAWLSFHEFCHSTQAALQADKLCHMQQNHLHLPYYPRHRHFSLPGLAACPARGNKPSSGGTGGVIHYAEWQCNSTGSEICEAVGAGSSSMSTAALQTCLQGSG